PNPFKGGAGDYSGGAGVAYRQRMDQFYSQREFADPNPSAVHKWKVRQLEETNRRWFYQQSEDVFRSRSGQFVKRRAHSVQVKQLELYTPECDPGFTLSYFLQMISSGNGDFSRLSQLVDLCATRTSCVGEVDSDPFIHWTGFGAFRTLSDS